MKVLSNRNLRRADIICHMPCHLIPSAMPASFTSALDRDNRRQLQWQGVEKFRVQRCCDCIHCISMRSAQCSWQPESELVESCCDFLFATEDDDDDEHKTSLFRALPLFYSYFIGLFVFGPFSVRYLRRNWKCIFNDLLLCAACENITGSASIDELCGLQLPTKRWMNSSEQNIYNIYTYIGIAVTQSLISAKEVFTIFMALPKWSTLRQKI